VDKLPQGVLVARGTFLLMQEGVVRKALELAALAAQRSAEGVTSYGPTAFGWESWLTAAKEQARLEGMRYGIELTTGDDR
jgi:hypothetical protein